MALLMSVPSGPEGASAGGGGGSSSASSSVRGLLPAANARFGLDAAVAEAIQKVWAAEGGLLPP